MQKTISQKGFTLIEILVVIGIIAILAAVVIVALNPGRQFAQARDTQRQSDVNTLLNAVGQRMADNRGLWGVAGNVWSATCGAATVAIPTAETHIGSNAGFVNLEACLVPTYVSTMVLDPSTGSVGDTGYTIARDTTTGRITIKATPEVAASISVTR